MRPDWTLVAVIILATLASGPNPTTAAPLTIRDMQRSMAKCQRAIASAGRKLFTGELAGLGACTKPALQCVQTNPSDPGCTTRTSRACATQLGARIPKLQAATLARIVTKCSTKKAPLATGDLLGSDGLSFGRLAATCSADFGIDICEGLPAVAACVAVAHTRAAHRTFGVAQPRATELIVGPGDVAPPPPFLPAYPGCGDCVPPPKAVGERVAKCGVATAQATGTFANVTLSIIEKCVEASLACTQNDDPGCTLKAGRVCRKVAAKLAAAELRLANKIAKPCAQELVSYATLGGAAGLNFDALASICEGKNGTLVELIDCLRRATQCEVASLVDAAIPRTPDLGDGVGPLAADLAASCPAPQSTVVRLQAAAKPRVDIGRLVKFPGFQLRRGGAPSFSPGQPQRVTVFGGLRKFVPGGTNRLRVRYRLGGTVRSQSGAAATPPELLVTARRDDLTVDGFFALPLPADLVEDELEIDVEYPAELFTCVFELVFAASADGLVSEYTPFEQVQATEPSPPAPGRLGFIGLEEDAIGLHGASAVAVSADAAHVYVAGTEDASLAVFGRDPSGVLSYVETEVQGHDSVEGLSRPTAVGLSPDGAHVYAAGAGEIGVFARDPGSGMLTFVEVEREGMGLLFSLSSVAFSPNGRNVYVTTPSSAFLGPGAVIVYTRDPLTGQLAFLESQVHGVNGAAGLVGPGAIAVSPDGAHVYVASYGSSDAGVAGAVALFTRDAASGALTFVAAQQQGQGGVAGLGGATDVVVTSDGGHVYVASSCFAANGCGLVAFARNAVSGVLTLVETEDVFEEAGIDAIASLAASPDGAHLYLGGRNFFFHLLYEVAAFERDATTGELSRLAPIGVHPGRHFIATGRVAVTASPDGASVYAANSDDHSVSTFTRDPGTGNVSLVGVARDGTGGLDEAEAVVVSPDGAHVYVAGRGDRSVAVYERDSALGTLEAVATQPVFEDPADQVHALVVSPDGGQLYALGDHSLAIFTRAPATGALSFVEVLTNGVNGVDGLESASALAMSPDGKHLYVTAACGNFSPSVCGIVIFERNSGTGVLAFRDVLRGVDGLSGTSAVTVSSDGAHVYVANAGDFSSSAALIAFRRDAATGALAFVEVKRQGVDGVDGLDVARAVAVAPDGRQVYVTGRGIGVFTRDPASGGLAFLEAHTQDVAGVDGLASGVAVAASGEALYVASGTDAIAVFQRDTATGRLKFTEVQRDGEGAVRGLGGASALAIDPDGTHLYATGASVDAVTIFQILP